MQPDVIVGIQARMGSSRLPGKVLMELAGVPLIRRVWDACAGPWERRVLVSDAESSKELRVYLTKAGMAWEAGSETDVLSRYVNLAKHRKPEVLVRVCADAPFLKAEWIADAVAASSGADRFGIGAVFMPGALHAGSWRDWVAAGNAPTQKDHEHAGYYFFEEWGVTLDGVPPGYLTVNTLDDLLLARTMLETPRTGEP